MNLDKNLGGADLPGAGGERLKTTLSHALEASGRTLKKAAEMVQPFSVELPLALSGLLWAIDKEIPLHQLDLLLNTVAVALLLLGSFNLGRRTKRILDAEMRGGDKVCHLSASLFNALASFPVLALTPLTIVELSKPSTPTTLANPITGTTLFLLTEITLLAIVFETHQMLQEAGIIGKTKDQNR